MPLYATKKYFVINFIVIDSNGRHEHIPSIHRSMYDANFIGELVSKSTKPAEINRLPSLVSELIRRHDHISTELRNRFEKLVSSDDIVDEIIDIVGLDAPRLSSRHYRAYINHFISSEELTD